MAGSPARNKSKRSRGDAAGRTSRRGGPKAAGEGAARDYAREAVAEWGRAARLGAEALSTPLAKAQAAYAAKRAPRSVADKLNPTKTKKGGPAGDLADDALGKLGGGGKVAAFLSLGSRMLDRVLPERLKQYGGDGSLGDRPRSEEEGAASDGGIPVPIQESIEVAASAAAVYDLATRFEEYPEFIPRVQSAERLAENKVELVATIRGVPRQLGIEVVEARRGERIDWRSTKGIRHSGAVTFHELAPRLTHVELSIDPEPHGALDRLARRLHLTDRAIREDMHRFKAYAELYEDAEAEAVEAGEGAERASGASGRTEAAERDEKPAEAQGDEKPVEAEADEEPVEAEADEEPVEAELVEDAEAENRAKTPEPASEEEEEPDTERAETHSGIRRRAVAHPARQRR